MAGRPLNPPKTRSLTLAALIVAVAAIAGLGQAPVTDAPRHAGAGLGSLSGRLTDLHSKPIDGAAVVLRNSQTGAEARTVTEKNGSYHFTGLAAGEYTLLAQSDRFGHGSVEWIVVSAGIEAHVEAAMALQFDATRPVYAGLPVRHPDETSTRAAPAIASPLKLGDSTPPAATSNRPVDQGSVSAALARESEPNQERSASDRKEEIRLILASVLDRVTPPAETALLESTFAGVPLERVEPPARSFKAHVRETPPVEAVLVRAPISTERPTMAALAAQPATGPIQATSVASIAKPAPAAFAAIDPRLNQVLSSSPTPLAALHPVFRAIAVLSAFRLDWALEIIKGATLSNAAAQSALAQSHLRAMRAARQPVDPVTPIVATTLTAEQLQSLPLAGRKWQNFVLDTPAASPESAAAVAGTNPASPVETSIDGTPTRLAFGSTSGSAHGSSDGSPSPGQSQPWASGHGLQVAESAIREVESAAGSAEADAERAAGGHVNVTTQLGTQGFHGQGFLFDRQNSWGARNPFTTWVQQTAGATAGTIPTFTAEPYTPPDHETVWGLGAGSEWKKKRLFWFGAVDLYFRNDPGLATVKHPAEFFAQPANNQMQVLAARLGLPAANPVPEGLAAYSTMLQTLDDLLGPAPRTASQWVGFARIDWQATERHRFTLESIGAHWDSPGGGLTRVSEPYGSRSFGNGVASEEMLMGRWEAFLTSNLLAVTQASAGRNILATHAETPSTFEQTLLSPSIWGQLPQIVVDSRNGFTIGNPARFGRGSFPDEKLDNLQQSLDWVHGTLLVKAGFELSHNGDTTELLRNQTGTYHYSHVENFISDALAFQKFGLAGNLIPAVQHGCDQTGTVWVDSERNLRGLGSLPCYSYYTQEMGPSGWHLSTNDWAGFATAQWQPAKRMVFSTGLRWEREQLPAPIAALNNPELPPTEKLPSLGNNWGPRVSLALGSAESRWPVMRIGYGMYFSRTSNQVIETALAQTGSFNGDLSFFLRPTDNLYEGGAPPFPYVLAGAPGSVVKPGAVEFAPRFHNPEVQQAVAALEKTLPGHIQVTASAELSLGRRLPITVDANIDPVVNPGTITYAVVDGTGAGPIKTPQITVPFYASWPSSTSPTGFGGRLNPGYQQISQIMSRANSTYEAAVLRVERYGKRGLSLHAHYAYAHAMDWNPDESSQVAGSSLFDPADFRQEYGTSNLDIRHSAAVMAAYTAPWKLHGNAGKLANGWTLSGIGDFRSGLPYTMRTAGSLAEEFVASTGVPIVALGPGMNGSGGDNRVYGVGRNTYRYPATWKADLRLGKRIDLGGLRELELMAETFNLFNHQNITEIETTGYTIEPGNLSGGLPTLNFLTGLKANTTEFGQPLNINATDFYRERQIQVGMRMRF